MSLEAKDAVPIIMKLTAPGHWTSKASVVSAVHRKLCPDNVYAARRITWQALDNLAARGILETGGRNWYRRPSILHALARV